MNSLNKKIIYISSAMVATALIVVIILLIHAYNNNKRNQVLETYGIVKKVNSDSIIVEESNTNKEITFIKDGKTEDFNEGDLVVVKTRDNKIQSYEVIVDDYADITTTSHPTTTTTTTTIFRVTDNTTSTSAARVPDTTTSQPTSVKVLSNDEIIINYLNEEKENVDKITIKEKAKQLFTTIVDFIFYDGTIKGIKFSQLKDSTKAKVIYYALLIDSGIESKFPDYKVHLNEKYQDIKAKLLAEFLELKYFVCSKSGDDCEQIKTDLAILKSSLDLTWDIIKDTFIYVKDLSAAKIKSWYESFRG